MARLEYPLAAVAGGERVKLALSLLAIDPLLKGLFLRGSRGSGKTIMARSIQPLLPVGAPFIEAPASVSLDRLLGGIDWIPAPGGVKCLECDGLLAKAAGGVLFSDHVNLLPPAAAAQIASALAASSFVWIGTFDPGDGVPGPLSIDAVGLHVTVDDTAGPEDREVVARRTLAFQSRPEEFVASFAAKTAREAGRVRRARLLLHGVVAGPELKRRLCEKASEEAVEGNRAGIFAYRAARAHAALYGRAQVEDADLRAAWELVLEPRARSGRLESAPPLPAAGGTGSTSRTGRPAVQPALAAPPIDNPAPRIARPPRRERDHTRGRYAGALETDPGHGVVAVDATLRAAAPFQSIRRSSGRGVRLLPGDLRYKRFRRKSGIGIVIALDASGSMAQNRIQQAKGAVIRLLRDVYVHRDTVALVAFRGDHAELLMRLGRSVELACRALDELPAGGGTPLAAGILCALEEARRAATPPLLVLITDGKPNVSVSGAPVWEELEQVAAAVRQARLASIVIDTSVGRQAANRVAAMLGAEYVALPRMDPGAVYRHVKEAAAAVR